MEKVVGHAQPFEFVQCVSLIKSTGRKAATLREMRHILTVLSEESIFHHTCQYFLKGRVREYTNDFAQWVGESLEERALSEQLAGIDPYVFKGLDALRDELMRVIDEYLAHFPEPRDARPGDEFFFNETVTLAFPSGVRARNLAEFLLAVKYVDPTAIYYHFYEARMRLGSGADDFSQWLEKGLVKTVLAEKIRSIDPFMHGIEGIRRHIADSVEAEVKSEMEAMN